MPRIKSKAPDALFLLLNKTDIELVLKRSREIKLSSKIITSLNSFDAFNLSADRLLYEGICFPYPLEQLQKNKNFVSRYKMAYAENPRVGSDSTYDGVMLLQQAFQNAKEQGISLKEALRSIRFNGLAGEYKFDQEFSLSTGQASLVCIKNGRMEIEISSQEEAKIDPRAF